MVAELRRSSFCPRCCSNVKGQSSSKQTLQLLMSHSPGWDFPPWLPGASFWNVLPAWKTGLIETPRDSPHPLHLHPSFSDLLTLQRDQVGAKECWKGAPKGQRGTAAGRAGEVAFPSHPDIEVGGDEDGGQGDVSRWLRQDKSPSLETERPEEKKKKKKTGSTPGHVAGTPRCTIPKMTKNSCNSDLKQSENRALKVSF